MQSSKAEPPSPSPEYHPPATAFQAYQPIPPQHHGFFHQASSSQLTPFMRGSQYLMAPHGTTGTSAAHMLPISQSFGHCGVVPSNDNADASGVSLVGVEVETELLQGHGSLVDLDMNVDVIDGELGRASGAFGNGVFFHSGESGTEGASEGSHPNYRSNLRGACGEKVSDGVDGPSTDLNIGIDYPGATTASHIPSADEILVTTFPGAMDRSGSLKVPIQDEKELRRQKRKVSNRESARRSRVKKQAECEDLTKQAAMLSEENDALREEINKIREGYNQLLSQNTCLQERIGNIPCGTKDSKIHESYHCSGDNNHQGKLDSDVQAGEPKQSGYSTCFKFIP